MPAEELGDRCAIVLAIMFAILAYKLILSEQLPKIATLTLIDRYLLYCVSFVMLVVFIAAVEFVVLVEHEQAVANIYARAGVCLAVFVAWALAHLVGLRLLGASQDHLDAVRERVAEAAEHDWFASDDTLWLGPISRNPSPNQQENELRTLLQRATTQLVGTDAQPPLVRLFDPGITVEKEQAHGGESSGEGWSGLLG
jgi:hypothetical protein